MLNTSGRLRPSSFALLRSRSYLNCGVDVLNEVKSWRASISGCLRASAISAWVASLSAALPRPVKILDLELETARGAESRDRRRVEAQREGRREVREVSAAPRRRCSRPSAPAGARPTA